ncbi:MAG: Hsp20/alpha crystallin family protein [Saprospiraceae bacterium]|nr:Hsp20/alpha crystallin family protein [Saprospiraceae bacterium]
MNLVRRNYALSNSLSSLWNELFSNDFFNTNLKANNDCLLDSYCGAPAVNIKNEDEQFIIEVAAPGFKKDDFSIAFENHSLIISANKVVNNESDEKGSYTYREFGNKKFQRTFSIPTERVDTETINATYNAGVLLVNIPKIEKEDTKRNIEVL